MAERAYSEDVALITAQASAWAYSDLETEVARMKDVGFAADCAEGFRVDNSALFLNTYAVLLLDSSRREAVLAFRGTEFANGHYVDLLTDAAIDPVQYKNERNLRVHGGFFLNALAIWPKILRGIEAKLAQIDRLYVTGHSLGGALATLWVAELFLEEESNEHHALYEQLRQRYSGLYTFGQPMVGDLHFASRCEELFGKSTFRHVYKADLVPQLPPKSTGNFMHFGHEYQVGPDSQWHLAFDQTTQAYTLLLSLPLAGMAFIARQFLWSRKLPFNVSLADHSPLNYLDASKTSVS